MKNIGEKACRGDSWYRTETAIRGNAEREEKQQECFSLNDFGNEAVLLDDDIQANDDATDDRMANPESHRLLLFPITLYRLLENAEQEKTFSSIISWLPTGEGFIVHNQEKFAKHIIPFYFRQSKYKSFQRQLNLYGFDRMRAGPFKGKKKWGRNHSALGSLRRPVES